MICQSAAPLRQGHSQQPVRDLRRGAEWTWTDAVEEMHRAANALRQHGVERGEYVGIMLPNGADWLRTWWGLVALGAVIVPINPALRGTSLSHVVSDAHLRRVIAPADLAARFDAACEGVTVIDPVGPRSGDPSPVVLDPPLRPWDIHAVNYTSGTTGAPKGVLTTHQHSYAAALHNDWRATPSDVLADTMLNRSAQ